LIHFSSRLFERLECRDYARFDFRADSAGQIKLLEVNPNPGWCWDGKLNLMAGFAGIRYPQLLEMILNAAKERVGL
jgi:D-alanine-D-alanine ligase